MTPRLATCRVPQLWPKTTRPRPFRNFCWPRRRIRVMPKFSRDLPRLTCKRVPTTLPNSTTRTRSGLSDGAPQYYNNLGALYLTAERYDDSIAAFRKAAENLLFASPEVAWAGVGYAYFQKHDYAAAERYYKKARELNPRYTQALFRLGELYYGQDRPVEAVEAFEPGR